MKINGIQFPIGQDFFYYEATRGNNSDFEHRASGAYIFRPNGTNAVMINSSVTSVMYKGLLRD